jgi:hypothetical protein
MARALALAIVLVLTGTARAGDEPGVAERLTDAYGSSAGYRAVKKDVLRWHGTTRNGCVAFASTALRRAGVDVPERGVLDGEGISRITRVFVMYLEDQLGWIRITDARALEPGDLFFTTDVIPGYPSHVAMFAGWADRRRAVAWVNDNQGWRRKRALDPPAGSTQDPFAFALRAPRAPR